MQIKQSKTDKSSTTSASQKGKKQKNFKSTESVAEQINLNMVPDLSHPMMVSQRQRYINRLQKTIGNQYVQCMINQHNGEFLSIQRQSEEEEEEMIHTKMNGNIIRQANEEEEEKVFQKQIITSGIPEISSNLEYRINSKRGSGQPLPVTERAFYESAFNSDLSEVRVHTDSEADTLNRNLNSRAFTTGQNIFFKQGEFNLDSSSGKTLLIHELAHVMQQTGNKVKRKLVISNPGDMYEKEADVIARRIIQQKEDISHINTGNGNGLRIIDKKKQNNNKAIFSGVQRKFTTEKQLQEKPETKIDDQSSSDKKGIYGPPAKSAIIRVQWNDNYERFREIIKNKVRKIFNIPSEYIEMIMGEADESLVIAFMSVEFEARQGRVGKMIKMRVSSVPAGLRPNRLIFYWTRTHRIEYDSKIFYNDENDVSARIYFAFDETILDSKDREIIDESIQIIKRKIMNNQIRLIYIKGYADIIGTKAYNIQLSQRRANAVTSIFDKELKDTGILILPIGYGEQGTSKDSEEVRASNRRADIYCVKALPPRGAGNRETQSTKKQTLGFQDFRIRMIAGGEGAIGLGLGLYTFEIQIRNPLGRKIMISFIGGGIGTIGAGGYGPSEWTDFRTTVPMQLEDFEGGGRIAAAGSYVGGGAGISTLVFYCGDLPTQMVTSLSVGTGLAFGANWFHGWWEIRD